MRLRGLALSSVAIAFGLVLTGCARGVDASGSTSVASSIPSSEGSPTIASAAPERSDTPADEQPTCDSILNSDGVNDLAGMNLTATPYEPQSYNDAVVGEFATRGLVCQWGNSGDGRVLFAFMPLTEPEQVDLKSRLVRDGFETDDSLYPGFLKAPASSDDSYPFRGVAFSANGAYYTTFERYLDYVDDLS